MARPKEFDTQEVLDQALQVFWSKGYEASSLTDLLGAMGLSKSSFYETFGSKHELYLAALDRYRDTESAGLIAVLEGPTPARQAIEAVFGRLIDAARANGGQRGCFLNNCATELGGQDAQAAGRVARGMARIEQAFARAVARGQAAGDVSSERGADALGRTLYCILLGLTVMAKAGRDAEAMEDVVRFALEALD